MLVSPRRRWCLWSCTVLTRGFSEYFSPLTFPGIRDASNGGVDAEARAIHWAAGVSPLSSVFARRELSHRCSRHAFHSCKLSHKPCCANKRQSAYALVWAQFSMDSFCGSAGVLRNILETADDSSSLRTHKKAWRGHRRRQASDAVSSIQMPCLGQTAGTQNLRACVAPEQQRNMGEIMFHGKTQLILHEQRNSRCTPPPAVVSVTSHPPPGPAQRRN